MLYNIICLYFFLIATADIYSASRVNSLNGSAYARMILLLSIAISFYICGYSLELASNSVSQILFWNTVEYVGIPYVSALWLTSALLYTGRWPRRKGIRLLFAAVIFFVPAATMALRFTNSFHSLYFASVSFTEISGKLFLVKHMGPWMYVQMFHSLLMILLTLALYIREFVPGRGKETGKIILMLAASCAAVAGLFLKLLGPFRLPLDYMALCLPAACILVIAAMLRYDFLETKSMARSRVFEESGDAVVLMNDRNLIIDFNGRARQFFAQAGAGISNGYPEKLLEHTPELLACLTRASPSVVKLKIGGEERFYEIISKEIGTRASHGWIKIIRDVTENHRLNESLRRQAMADELSGLANRRAFFLRAGRILAGALEDGMPVCLLMMDLDHFKAVNDRYGHQMGDEVIREFGAALRKKFGAKFLPARLGGEEFCALLWGVRGPDAFAMADSLRSELSQREFGVGEGAFRITVSIGIATANGAAQTLDDLMQRADGLLYISKDSGRNRITQQ